MPTKPSLHVDVTVSVTSPVTFPATVVVAVVWSPGWPVFASDRVAKLNDPCETPVCACPEILFKSIVSVSV